MGAAFIIVTRSQDHFLDLVEAAYELPEQPEAFETFIQSIKVYLFGDLEGSQVVAPGHTVDQEAPTLERLTDRVQRLIQRLDASNEPAQSRFHAIIEIARDSKTVTGNPAAERLLDCSFPLNFDALPLDYEAMRFISEYLFKHRQAHMMDKVFLTTVGTEERRSCMALIQRPENVQGIARISISYIDWTEKLLRRIGEAFELSNRELSVLQGYLEHLSAKDIAKKSGRSLETIKSQSKSILRKTGCQRMSDVMQLSASIAYLLRQIPDGPEPKARLAWRTPERGLHTFRSSRGRTVAWYRVGEGTQPVLFIHGLIQGPFFPSNIVNQLNQLDLYLVCPSRPGFGFSDPSTSRRVYNETVLDDASELLDQIGVTSCPVLVHQGGSSHGFRIASRLGERCKHLTLVDGGVPVHDRASLAFMDSNSRMMAAANRRSPSFLKMLTRLGLATYKLRGIDAYLQELYKASHADLRALKQTEFCRVLSEGIFHTTEQDAEVWVRDGNAAMENWSDAFTAYRGGQTWVLGEDARILSHKWIESYLENVDKAEVHLIEGAGNTLLYTHAKTEFETVRATMT